MRFSGGAAGAGSHTVCNFLDNEIYALRKEEKIDQMGHNSFNLLNQIVF